MTENFYLYAIACILVSGVATALTRFLPFILFSGNRQMPPKLKRIADILPSAVIAVLVVYGVSPQLSSVGADTLYALAALTLTVLTHLWRRNTLFSMFVGTVSYMLMVNLLK